MKRGGISERPISGKKTAVARFYQDESYANTKIAHKATWLQKPTEERLRGFVRHQDLHSAFRTGTGKG